MGPYWTVLKPFDAFTSMVSLECVIKMFTERTPICKGTIPMMGVRTTLC